MTDRKGGGDSGRQRPRQRGARWPRDGDDTEEVSEGGSREGRATTTLGRNTRVGRCTRWGRGYGAPPHRRVEACRQAPVKQLGGHAGVEVGGLLCLASRKYTEKWEIHLFGSEIIQAELSVKSMKESGVPRERHTWAAKRRAEPSRSGSYQRATGSAPAATPPPRWAPTPSGCRHTWCRGAGGLVAAVANNGGDVRGKLRQGAEMGAVFPRDESLSRPESRDWQQVAMFHKVTHVALSRG